MNLNSSKNKTNQCKISGNGQIFKILCRNSGFVFKVEIGMPCLVYIVNSKIFLHFVFNIFFNLQLLSLIPYCLFETRVLLFILILYSNKANMSTKVQQE